MRLKLWLLKIWSFKWFILYVLLAFGSLVFMSYLFCKGIDEINKEGLKGVCEQIWYGEKNKK